MHSLLQALVTIPNTALLLRRKFQQLLKHINDLKDRAFHETIKIRRLNKIVEIQIGKIPQNPNLILKFKKLQAFDQAPKKMEILGRGNLELIVTEHL